MSVKQYRKKPIVIEAMRVGEGSSKAICDWSGAKAIYGVRNRIAFLVIKTLEGDMKAVRGDYIIKGVKGEFYPCKPDIFEATYEPVQPPTLNDKEQE